MFYVFKSVAMLVGRIDTCDFLRQRRSIQSDLLILVQICAIHYEALVRWQPRAASHFLGKPNPSLDRSSAKTGKSQQRSINQAASCCRNLLICLRPVMSTILAVSGKQLITAHTRKQHSGILVCFSADKVCRYDRGIRGRLVHVPREFGQKRRDIWFDHDALVFAAKMPG